MNFFCSEVTMPAWDKFTGCDGKKWSNKFLQYHIDKAVQEENYEWAQECKDELDRRLATKNLSWKKG
jgi:hypothetical protein